MESPDESDRRARARRGLRCPECGETYRDRWRCRCGAPLDFADPPAPEGSAPAPESFDARGGLWAFADLLAVGDDPRDRVTLGEGMTPLVDADEGRESGGRSGPEIPPWNASFKLEYAFPTGSFKDRGATATLTRARELGVERVVEDSSGNAGAAIATYAARAGIGAEIYVPADAKESKLRAIRRAGAEPVRIEGSRQDVTDACVAALNEDGSDAGTDAWYASHAWNPAFFEGTATVAYEIALQRGWDAPDAVVTPLGHGTLFLGAYRGFRRLERAGWIDSVPRLYGAQAAGVAPVVEALHGPEAARPDGTVNDAADGIQIAEPVRDREIRAAIDATGGDALAVTEAAATRELDRLHAAGFYTEPTCAVAPAALRILRERGEIGPDEDVVVPLTGSGLKG
ncbi:Threonine synthase [Halorubrum californiense DSM 19288]|uniref:Threonine synthase n=1 Tax=Halorubrum californiense DSM 19288 TaxID=1227465 RepID=M0E9P6_9EURY|nr:MULTISPECIES: threonine synthase [Halorubrum]ELZ43788.1 Threonine synthase [Halorubrum californiense DSM 19288]TKX72798.1 pyridoxal-phosphate dependent enzyme [Halorubrum sp. GN11GM_10-3_MGM]